MTLAGVPTRLAIGVDPTVAEAAVLRVVSRGGPTRSDALAAHRRRSEPLYEIDDATERDAAFGRLAMIEFDELDLAEPLRRAVEERPAIARRASLVLLGDARGHVDEGVTCESGGRRLGIRVDAARFADPAGLLAWARHVLGHAEDTLDPTFRFEPGWEGPAAGRVAPATQARLHRLWDVSVDARLAESGRLEAGAARRHHRERMGAALPGLTAGSIDAILQLLWEGPRPTFPVLLAWSARPTELLTAAGCHDAVLPRPDRCPLCRFPGDDVRPPASAIAGLVVAEYPDWRPEMGLCGRCTDRYVLAGRPRGGGP